MRNGNTERDKLRKRQIKKAQKLLDDGATQAAVAEEIGVSDGTLRSWLQKKWLYRKDDPRPGNLKLSVAQAPTPEQARRQLEDLDKAGVFAKEVAQEYKTIWFKIRERLDDDLSDGEVSAKEIKDWVDILHRLGTFVTQYENENAPAQTEDEAALAEELRERNKRNRELYTEVG